MFRFQKGRGEESIAVFVERVGASEVICETETETGTSREAMASCLN